MDQTRFDHFVQSFSATNGNRRFLTQALTALPIAGIAGLLAADETDARRRKRNSQPRAEKKKKKKLPFCLNGQTVRVSKKAKKKLLNQGATPGACLPGPTCTLAWRPQASIGTAVDGPSQIKRPASLVLSPDNLTLWVGDSWNNRISVWTRPSNTSTAWTHQTNFGSSSSGPTQLSFPSGLAVAADTRTLWITEGSSRVSVWTRPGATGPTSTTWTPHSQFGSFGSMSNRFRLPDDIAVSADLMTVWIADRDNNRISIWDRATATDTLWRARSTFGIRGSGASEFNAPSGVVLSADQLTLWVADSGNDRISVWSRSIIGSDSWSHKANFGSTGSGPGQLDKPRQVALSANELIMWIADYENDRISIWTRANNSTHTWVYQDAFGSAGAGASEFQVPMDVAVSADGLTAFVADNANDRVSVWARTCE